jgi:drug/metabolite transporter (DMT)-like permease
MMQSRFLTALISGALGATASCLAKFAFDSSVSSAIVDNNTLITEWFCTEQVGSIQFSIPGTNNNVNLCFLIQLILLRGICFAGMILCNAFMLGTFLKGMEESGSVAGTALSTAANFIISACYGYLFWNELFSSSWWIGFGMVVLGVMLLANTNTTSTTTKRKSSRTPEKED